MKYLSRRFPAVIAMVIIFLLSSLPGDAVNNLGLGSERLHVNGHFILFFLLTFTYFKATKDLYLTISMSILYAVFDEFHQMYTPFRSTSLFDIYIDIGGSLLAGLFIWKLLHILPKKLKIWLEN